VSKKEKSGSLKLKKFT